MSCIDFIWWLWEGSRVSAGKIGHKKKWYMYTYSMASQSYLIRIWGCCSFLWLRNIKSTIMKKPPPLHFGGSNLGPPMICFHHRTFLHKLPIRCVPHVMPHYWLASLSTKFSSSNSVDWEPADGSDWVACEPPLIDFADLIYSPSILGKEGICLGLIVELGGPCWCCSIVPRVRVCGGESDMCVLNSPKALPCLYSFKC